MSCCFQLQKGVLAYLQVIRKAGWLLASVTKGTHTQSKLIHSFPPSFIHLGIRSFKDKYLLSIHSETAEAEIKDTGRALVVSIDTRRGNPGAESYSATLHSRRDEKSGRQERKEGAPHTDGGEPFGKGSGKGAQIVFRDKWE